MTKQEKANAVFEFLTQLDCSGYNEPSFFGEDNVPDTTFRYELGSNEGCYMTIGGYVFRCHAESEEGYRNAVAFYLTLF